MALLQTTIDDDVKERADKVFARSGLTSAMAMRAIMSQVAYTGISPFDGLFLRGIGPMVPEHIRREMVRAEAIEYGLLPDDSFDARTMPDDVLSMLGVTAEEVEP